MTPHLYVLGAVAILLALSLASSVAHFIRGRKP